MGFFGIVNGRGCYCTPYFTPMESDSTQCDANCEGDNTLMCGGKSKSSVFAMHMCDSTKADLGKDTKHAQSQKKSMDALVKKSSAHSKVMQFTAVDLQKSFGAVGDSGATGLMQSAKVFAGELIHKAEEADDVSTKLAELYKSSSSLTDFTDPATVTKAERTMEGIWETVAKSLDLADELQKLESQAAGESEVFDGLLEAGQKAGGNKITEPVAEGDIEVVAEKTWCYGAYDYLGGGRNSLDFSQCAQKVQDAPESCVSGFFNFYQNTWGWRSCYCVKATDCKNEDHQYKYRPCPNHGWHGWSSVYHVKPKAKASLIQYYPTMYYVDKQFEEMPMTCSGDLAAKPIIGQSKDGCAAACDSNIHSCVGFQHFNKGGHDLCFLLSNFKTGFYYTGCGKSFLQAGADKAPFEAGCYAKLSKFVGTTLKPNPSGKCKQCFKELTKANRCYK